MSYDLEFSGPTNNDNGIKQPLLKQGLTNGGASLTEIQENMNRVSRNIATLTTYSQKLGKGKMSSQEHSAMNRVLVSTSTCFQKAGELLENYK